MKVVFTAYAKEIFYKRARISRFVMYRGCVPINPFLNFDYFLIDSMERYEIEKCNNELIKRADELWVFDEVSDGVAKEIELAKELHKPVEYYKSSSVEGEIGFTFVKRRERRIGLEK